VVLTAIGGRALLVATPMAVTLAVVHNSSGNRRWTGKTAMAA